MTKPNDQFEALARDAAERIEASRAMQQQLTLLPDEQADQGGEVRRGRGAGRAMSQMREWLASRGLRLPEEVLAEMAGLQHRDEVILATMADAERIVAWAESGAGSVKGAPAVQTLTQRVNVFMQLLAMRLRAADALMPYGAPKATPDAAPVNVTQIVVAGGQQAAQRPAQVIDQARDVTPDARRIGPPPMPHQIQQYQTLGDQPSEAPRTDRRTDDGDL
ncbi:hypothetical protein PARHAE_01096 [Paracoccus haematequi]|uniref:Uncharacterized protein n=1 Tax=Paracoccus haematequi TaxID=2491866 RepID=A0A447IK94_9RHOB|nr:hypothetical protein [Paracoccus haematequi]VDS07916.1 hypothetical protein PARHAE_01096 [Paracoccus haematequi]